MTFKQQLRKIKENWLLLLLVVIIVTLPFFNTFDSSASSYGYAEKAYYMDEAVADRGLVTGPFYNQDFAPDVIERKITTTTFLASEISRGEFTEADKKLRDIVKSTDSHMLTENVNRHGEGVSSYFSGWYEIKVDTDKYDAIISQLRQIGEVISFEENKQDITGRYTNLQIELAAEKEKLKRYQQLFEETTNVDEKIRLTDLIFNQERMINYLEDSLKSTDQKVDYSTINVQLTEKRSEYLGIAFVGFSDLVRSLVNSINSLLKLLFVILPYLVVGGLLWLIIRKFRK